MPYNPAALAELNDSFAAAVAEMFPFDYSALRSWLRLLFEISTDRNVDAWFGKASFTRKYLSANTPNAQKDNRIIFAEAFLGRLRTGRPLRCKDFYLDPEGGQFGFDKFYQYFTDDYVRQNIDTLDVDAERLHLCWATESDTETYTKGQFTMNDPRFDEFRSGEEEE